MAWTAPRTWTTGELVTAAQLNTHVRDNLDAAFPTDAVWTTWSPTYANLTIGNGTVTARYMEMGETFVAHWVFTLGSSSAVGTGPTVSLPVTTGSAVETPIGTAYMLNAGTQGYHGIVLIATSTTVRIVGSLSSGTYVEDVTVSATVPFTWGTADKLIIAVVGERA
jgi:hypothetical protein